MQLPKWVTDSSLSDQDREKQRINYYLRVAALHHNPHGSIVELSRAVGFFDTYLRNSINRGHLNRKAALAIEGLVGKEVFDASLFISI